MHLVSTTKTFPTASLELARQNGLEPIHVNNVTCDIIRQVRARMVAAHGRNVKNAEFVTWKKYSAMGATVKYFD